jgi:predicted PurR-regulated permease PerM
MLVPFLSVIAWSSVLGITFYPVHARLLRQTGRPSLSALVSTLLVMVTIVIPLVFVAGLVVNELLALKTYLEQAFSGGLDVKFLGPLQDAAKAHEMIETGHTRGKIVLKVAEAPGN